MLTTISIILIIISCLVIFFIISKKLPALAVLDVDSLPEEKEARFKEQIMRQRLERDLGRIGAFFGRLWKWGQKFSAGLHWLHDQLRKIKLKQGARLSFRDKEEAIRKMAGEAEKAIADEDYSLAESRLISAIALDDRNLPLFLRLAEVYAELRKLADAKATYRYALKLMRQKKYDKDFLRGELPQEAYFSLAWVERDSGDYDGALDSVREALEFEPSNPRYLDLILDLGIMRKDKKLCEESLARLVEANPENNKIQEWQDKIDKLPF